MIDKLHIRPATGPCEVHDWPTNGLPERLITAMRERHGKGGITACREYVERAKGEADRVRGATPKEPTR